MLTHTRMWVMHTYLGIRRCTQTMYLELYLVWYGVCVCLWYGHGITIAIAMGMGTGMGMGMGMGTVWSGMVW